MGLPLPLPLPLPLSHMRSFRIAPDGGYSLRPYDPDRRILTADGHIVLAVNLEVPEMMYAVAYTARRVCGGAVPFALPFAPSPDATPPAFLAAMEAAAARPELDGPRALVLEYGPGRGLRVGCPLGLQLLPALGSEEPTPGARPLSFPVSWEELALFLRAFRTTGTTFDSIDIAARDPAAAERVRALLRRLQMSAKHGFRLLAGPGTSVENTVVEILTEMSGDGGLAIHYTESDRAIAGHAREYVSRYYEHYAKHLRCVQIRNPNP